MVPRSFSHDNMSSTESMASYQPFVHHISRVKGLCGESLLS